MRVRPLHAYRWAHGRDLTSVVAPPYDQISPAMQERLYAMSPDNIVRVTLPPSDEPGRRPLRARPQTLDGGWPRACGRARRAPAIYPYTQTYTVGGREVTRAGFVALGRGDRVRPGRRAAARADARRAPRRTACGCWRRRAPTSGCCSC